MNLTDLIGPDDVHVAMKADCKKQVLQDLARFASAKTGISEDEIFKTLLEREKLGSTGVGNGIAIPHGKLENLPEATAIMATLSNPVDFDSDDEVPVDVVFLLLAPEEANADHLKALAKIARILRQPQTLKRLREAQDKNDIFGLLSGSQTPHAA